MIPSMPRRVLSASLSAILTACAAATPASADVILYVSPSGNDAWSGKLAAPSADKSDGPLATPARARDAARAAKAQKLDGPITVVLRGGVYFLSEPLTLTEADSGTEKSPVTWSAFPGESPVLSAGRRIAGWQKTTVNGQGAWIARLPLGGEGNFWFRALWVNGHRAVRARWPKHGTFAVAETRKAKTHAEWRHPESEFPFHEDDVIPWSTAADGEAILTSRWTDARLPISSIDPAAHVLHSSKLAGFHPETDDRFYIENIKECLTEPGEWYLDRQENAVYLIPPAGVKSPNDADVVAPVLPQVLRLTGDIAGRHWVEHITFRGITFAHSEWYHDHVAPGEKPDPARTGFNQASIGVPGAVWGQGLRSCTFDHCTIAHVGGYGIELGGACQHNRITHCTITDLAAGGIKIGEPAVRDDVEQQAFGNEVSDCRIFALGRDAQIQRTRLEDHKSFSFENNIVYWKTGALLAGRWDKLNVAFDHNTYWHEGGGDILFGKLAWQPWRAAGMDRDSVIADPGFADADHGDFHFAANGKGIHSGFKPFELTGFGPRP